MDFEFIEGLDTNLNGFQDVARVHIVYKDRIIRFVCSEGRGHQVCAFEWERALQIDPGLTFLDTPCRCCNSLPEFAEKHVPLNWQKYFENSL